MHYKAFSERIRVFGLLVLFLCALILVGTGAFAKNSGSCTFSPVGPADEFKVAGLLNCDLTYAKTVLCYQKKELYLVLFSSTGDFFQINNINSNWFPGGIFKEPADGHLVINNFALSMPTYAFNKKVLDRVGLSCRVPFGPTTLGMDVRLANYDLKILDKPSKPGCKQKHPEWDCVEAGSNYSALRQDCSGKYCEPGLCPGATTICADKQKAQDFLAKKSGKESGEEKTELIKKSFSDMGEKKELFCTDDGKSVTCSIDKSKYPQSKISCTSAALIGKEYIWTKTLGDKEPENAIQDDGGKISATWSEVNLKDAPYAVSFYCDAGQIQGTIEKGEWEAQPNTSNRLLLTKESDAGNLFQLFKLDLGGKSASTLYFGKQGHCRTDNYDIKLNVGQGGWFILPSNLDTEHACISFTDNDGKYISPVISRQGVNLYQ